MADRYEGVPHRLLRTPVRDIASGSVGVLMAVLRQNVSDTGIEHWAELAYIRLPSGLEISTSVDNVEAV
ncbi:hypothetical protein ACFY0N_13010 [Streptomyces vinaceus]|uniref:hypothetical protein n=1 Tax=Streptomyces vinaceus TaxID=1960 RepID=UPI00367825C3